MTRFFCGCTRVFGQPMGKCPDFNWCVEEARKVAEMKEDKRMLRVHCPKCGTSYKRGERHACAERASSPPHEPLLASRERTHGSYADTARLAQVLKADMRNLGKWNELENEMRESLDMIATKKARILSGDARCLDHWRDISGYALLVVELLERLGSAEPSS